MREHIELNGGNLTSVSSCISGFLC